MLITMGEQFIDLELPENRPLVDCLNEYPCVFDIFANIRKNRPLLDNVTVEFENSLETLLNHVFLPILEKHGAIEKSDEQTSGYYAKIDSMRGKNLNEIGLARAVKHSIIELTESISEHDDNENVLLAVLRGEYKISRSQEYLKFLRQKTMEFLDRPDDVGDDVKKLRVVLACKIEKE